MKTEWNLDVFYTGIDDPSYEADFESLNGALKALHEAVLTASEKEEKERAEALLTAMEGVQDISYRLGNYLSLRQSVNTQDGTIMAQMNRLMQLVSGGTADLSAATRILGQLADVDALSGKSELIGTYKALILNAKKESEHLLSDEVEAMISQMDLFGGSAWGSLQSFMTSTVKVDYEGETITLSEVRNLAYSDDAKVRKAAYEAELKAYEKIQDAVAFSLNNIKNQVTMLCRQKGYESPLDKTLQDARMSRETLDAMLDSIREYLPAFRKYMRMKGRLLGYENGLPFYELFAPIGSDEKKYTVEEARDYLVECFNDLTPEIASLMKEAFDNEWIDFFPKAGKEGGAFCSGVPHAKQSRILTNYDGTLGAIDTLAHELGHAFHNRQVENEAPLNQDYPMPVAETASTFDEVHFGHYALKQAKTDDEKLALLESDLKESNQCVVDILSRYLFETAVFEKAQGQFLMAGDLKDLMLQAQKEAYGDGLDENFLHPYMWTCKSHYYSSGLSFYNFPYAFGNLFAKGLYALYLEQGDPFIQNYKEMLRTTPVHTIEEDGQMLGIDLTKKEFWEKSLQMLADEIEEFCALAEKKLS